MDIKLLLQQAGVRSTKLRLQILDLLDTNHLLSADEIVEILNRTQKTADRVTIYRNLESLQIEGILCIHHFGDRQAKYEIRDYHSHIICIKCHKISNLSDAQLVLPTGIKDFEIDHYHLEFYGYCSDCKPVIKKPATK